MLARILPALVLALPLLTPLSGTAAAATFDDRPGIISDGDHDGIDDAFEQQLANKYAPVIAIEPDESNYPVNVEWFLSRAHLQYHEDCSGDIDDDIGPNPVHDQHELIGNPPWSAGAHCGEDDDGYSHPPHREIKTTAADPDGQVSAGAATTGYSDQQTFLLPDLDDEDRVGSTDPREWKTYFHAYPTWSGGLMLQYWHVFAYNQLGVLGFGDHGGDWDATVHVELDSNLKLARVWFSRHSDDHPGTPFNADQLTLYDGTHTVMAIDGGGHAAFRSPGDFCDNGSPAGGRIVWPIGADLTDPAQLGGPWCSVVQPVPQGGVIWETWDNGLVKATSNLTHQIPLSSQHGGMVNLGEYNPCTPVTCNGSFQASTLLAGEFHPLNDQVFIQYEGRWGSLPHWPSTFDPPRGPVFQGQTDDGSQVRYTAWYNQGDSRPAGPDHTPWRVPPASAIGTDGPTYTDGGTTFLPGDSKIRLIANERAEGVGGLRTFYRLTPDGGPSTAWIPYTAEFSLPSPDARYTVEFYSSDDAGNAEDVHSASFVRDTTAPAVNLTSPTVNAYPHSQKLTLQYTVDDGAIGSGVAAVNPTLDGSPTVGGHGLESGTDIDLLTEVGLGQHTFRLQTIDKLGNSAVTVVTFDVLATAASIKDDVTAFVARKEIDPDIAPALTTLLDAAADQRQHGFCRPAAVTYHGFQDEVGALVLAKEVTQRASDVLKPDAQYLIDHCP